MFLIIKNQNLLLKNWFIIDSESKGNYSKDEETKFLSRSIESGLCDVYILVTGNTVVKKRNDAILII